MGVLMLGMAAYVSVMGSVGADRRPLDGYVDGTHLVVSTADGARCQGELLPMTKDGGLGSLTCADGRKGSFTWSFFGRSQASGDGWLAGEPLTLVFTHTPG